MNIQRVLLDLYARLTSDEEHHPLMVPVRATVRWCGVFYDKLNADQAFVRAAGMGYTTLVALVPLLLLVSGILSVTGLFEVNPEALETMIFQTVLADIPGVQDFLMEGIQNIDVKALSVAGLIGLVFIAARLYLMVERAYNDIFNVQVKRNLPYRLLNFYFTLTVVPVVGAVIVFSVLEVAGTGAGRQTIQSITQVALLFGALLTALKTLPCTPVQWGPAILGAGVSCVSIEVGHRLFGLYVTLFASNDPLRLVYGSVGLIPVFLLWLYMLWIFVLLGVEVAYVAQNYSSLLEVELDQVESRRTHVHWPSLASGLRLLAVVARRFDGGHGGISTSELSKLLVLNPHLTAKVARVWADAGILIETDESTYVPGRPADRLPIEELLGIWRSGTERAQGDGEGDVDPVKRGLDEAFLKGYPGVLGQYVDLWAGTIQGIDDPPSKPQTATLGIASVRAARERGAGS